MELAASPCYGFHFIRARNNETIGVQTRTMKEGGGMGKKTNKKKKKNRLSIRWSISRPLVTGLWQIERFSSGIF